MRAGDVTDEPRVPNVRASFCGPDGEEMETTLNEGRHRALLLLLLFHDRMDGSSHFATISSDWRGPCHFYID